MRVLALVPAVYNTSPGQRFRIEQWEHILRDMGVQIIFSSFESQDLHALIYRPGYLWEKCRLTLDALARRVGTMLTLHEFDLVYVYREAALLGPAIFERWIGARGIPLVYDFDDAIFLPTVSHVNRRFGFLKFPNKTASICRLATHIITGNQYLADYACQFNRHVTIVPSTIDTDLYTFRQPASLSNPPVIGWTGSFSTAHYLNDLRRVLSRVASHKRFRLRLIGAPDFTLDGVDVEVRRWCAAGEVTNLRDVDIGLMPLTDDAWARGKCGLKALQYMALGIPTVCAPVGVNCDIIQDGRNGFLAATEKEWLDKIVLLLESLELRTRFAVAGRATVETHYSARVQVPHVFEIFRSLVPSSHIPVSQPALSNRSIAPPEGVP